MATVGRGARHRASAPCWVIDLGVGGRISGHDIRVVQRSGNLADVSASPVELRIDDAPGVAVEVTQATSFNPSVGMIQRLENQVLKLPEEVTTRETRLAAAHQEVEDARAALEVPFKHQETLDAARWEVERIDRAMRGEQTPQPTLDPELEALKKRMRINFPGAPTAGRSAPGRESSTAGHSPEAARARYEQHRQEDGLGL